MSQVRRDADLGVFSRAEDELAPPRRGLLRYALPLAILVAFAAALRGPLLDLLRPRLAVTLARPVALDRTAASDPATAAPGGGAAAAPTLAVQAAGWIEADPFPSYAPALSGGVVAEVLVQESDRVEAGQPVARLVREDAALARDVAAAAVQRAEAARELAAARDRIARESFEAALAVTEAAGRARARAAGRAAAAEERRGALREGEAKVSLAESEVIVQRELAAAGAAGPRQIEIAEADLETAAARLAVLRAELSGAEAAAAEARAEEIRAERELELRFVDRLERDTAAAALAQAEGELAATRAALAEAELRVARTTVVAPSAGVVLERLAADGDALMPGAPVCSLYDPTRLRVRVDVPQGDVEALHVGQAAEVLSESRAGRPYRGEVLRIVQRADIQKVTLEAQVRVLDADGLLRPDMLTQVRFFTPGGGGRAPGERAQADGAAPGAELAVPAAALAGDALWVYDPVARVARRRAVESGGPAPGLAEHVLVRRGLLPTDKVVVGGRAALEARGDGGDGVPVEVTSILEPAAAGGPSAR